MLEQAGIGQKFSKPPSDYWGIEDPALALDFDRLHALRLQLHEIQVAKAQAEALKDGNGVSAADERLMRSNELGPFGPTARELDGEHFRSN